MVDKVELIHPKTLIVREVRATHGNKLRILERAGFILKSEYVPPKPKKEAKAEPTLAEKAKALGEKSPDVETKGKAVEAIHEKPQFDGKDLVEKAAKKKKKKKAGKKRVRFRPPI